MAELSMQLLVAAAALWLAGGLLALARVTLIPRGLLTLGCALGAAGAFLALPRATTTVLLPIHLADQPVMLHFTPAALWLMGFGLIPATLACALCSPWRAARPGWLVGAALSLLGAFGVFGLQDGYSLLICWELMSLGGAVLLLSERSGSDAGSHSLFMLALLEVGSVALMLALLLLAHIDGDHLGFIHFSMDAATFPGGLGVFIGILFLVGFGAKLGLLPFYEWYPGAYCSGSGGSGALMSGVVLNAAFFALSRALLDWLPAHGAPLFALGVVVTVVGVLSSILAALYALQHDDWRGLLSFSSAENASLAVTALGCALIFRHDDLMLLAGLAWTVALLHLAGHALAKGGLFLSADSVYRGSGSYAISQRGWLRRGGLLLGIGALFAAMSLAAMPPQAGFVSEWFLIQTVFQGFHLSSLGGRLVLALTGAGVALTAAIAFATFIKVMGIGLLGSADQNHDGRRPATRTTLSVLMLGLAVLTLAVGMPVWLHGLDAATVSQFGVNAADRMVDGWILVPLSSAFAFISPSKLIIAMPLLALLPLLLLLNARRHRIRRAPVWYGGLQEAPQLSATTSLSFGNAMRTVYSFIYRPTLDTTRAHTARDYFVHRLDFEAEVAPVFGPLLFAPARRLLWWLSGKLRALQSGDLNFYLGLIGALLVIILLLTLR